MAVSRAWGETSVFLKSALRDETPDWLAGAATVFAGNPAASAGKWEKHVTIQSPRQARFDAARAVLEARPGLALDKKFKALLLSRLMTGRLSREPAHRC